MAFDRRRRERGLWVLNSLASFSFTAPCTLSLSLSHHFRGSERVRCLKPNSFLPSLVKSPESFKSVKTVYKTGDFIHFLRSGGFYQFRV